MEIDYDKVDEAVLALLYLAYDEDNGRAWKSMDWDAMDRLHAKGLIDNPRSKNKSVVLSEAGANQAKSAFERLFKL